MSSRARGNPSSGFCQAIWQVERLEGEVFKIILASSHTRADGQLHALWRMLEQRCGIAHAASQGVIYCFADPWSKQLYVGQFNGTGWLRLQSHRQAQLARKMPSEFHDRSTGCLLANLCLSPCATYQALLPTELRDSSLKRRYFQ